MPPGLDVTVYCVIAFPPEAGEVKETVARPLLNPEPEFTAIAEVIVGESGTDVGVTEVVVKGDD